MADAVVSTKTGLALEIYAKTISSFERKNVFKELCTVQTITSGFMHRFNVMGTGDDADVTTVALGGEIATSQLSINKRDIIVDRTIDSRKKIDNWERKSANFDMVKTAVEQNAQAMARKVDKLILNEIDQTMLQPQLLAEDGSGKVVQDTSGVVIHDGLKDADTEVRGDAILEAIFKAGSILNRKDRTDKQRYVVMTPELYADLVLSKKAINADYNSGNNGSIKDGNVFKINDFTILTSNNIQTLGLACQDENKPLDGKTLSAWVLTEDVIGITELIGLNTDEWEDKKDKCYYVDVEYACGVGTLDPSSLVAIGYTS